MESETTAQKGGESMNRVIGETAGDIWKLLAAEKSLSVSGIVKKTETSYPVVNMGLGWLAREDKVVFSKTSRGLFVSLKDEQIPI